MSRLESHVANDEHLDTAVKSLRGYGVFKSEATKHCFDEASTLFTAQKSRRKDLIMALRHNVPLTPTTGQISIDQVDIGITRSAQGPDSIALSGWYEDMNSWCGMENFATDTHIEPGLSGMSNLDDIMALAGRLDS
ncbi:hypothetical protein BN1708_014740 [Verticillium longisporum]|uniref:Uncharacterized protein n=1 Tax=Verticillium longisporum TaxID=100787 RepID=A0A0G4LYZ0_VERLO|nr:hypothetical protein BN1708_014740 [Verticillium longisporum]